MVSGGGNALSSNATGGAGKMGIGIAGRALVQILSLAILARLLTPEDFGLVAMVVAIVAVAEVLRDFGLTFASVQSKEMSPALRSNLFWVNACAGVVTFGLAFAASWPIAWMYGDPRLLAITWAIAPVYLLSALTGQYQADLNRRMRFGTIVIAEVGAAFAGLLAAIIAAALGAGYWSLVVQQLATAFFTLASFVYFGRWLPSKYDRTVSVGNQVRHGFDIFLSQIINYASRNADAVIIGLRMDAVSVGFYSRAYQVFNTIVAQVNKPSTRVALPVLARLQDKPTEFAQFAARGQLTLMHPMMIVMSIGVGFGSTIIPLFLGDAWEAAALPFQILCIAGLSQASNYAIYWCYLATGRIRENVKLMLVWRPITIGFLVLGSNWGIVGVAAAFSLGIIGGWLLQLWWTRRVPIIPRLVLFAQAARAWLMYLPAGVAAAFSLHFIDGRVGFFVGVAAYLVALSTVFVTYPKVRRELIISVRTIASIVRSTLRGRRTD